MLPLVVVSLLAADPVKCQGTLVPPTGYVQKVAYVEKSMPDALELAKRRARLQLVQDQCKEDCAGLEALVRDWKNATDGDVVCAMAVIEQTDLQTWRASLTAAPVDEQFRVVVRELFSDRVDAGVPLAKGKKGKAPLKVAVAVGNVNDDGADGSMRGVWVALKMEAALTNAGIAQVKGPEGWTGKGIPSNATALLQGWILTREELGRRNLDVTWTVIFADGTSKTSTHVSMLATVAPPGPKPVTPLPVVEQPVVQLELADKATGHGGLCNGQKTQLFIKAREDRCVLVFDLFGDKGLLIFPNEARKDCLVRKGETLEASGPEGFAVMLDPNVETERFVAIAAPSREALPAFFRKWLGSCRLDAAQIRAVVLPDLPGVDRIEESFRVLPKSADACALRTEPAPALFKQAEQDLKQLAVCKAKEP